MTFPDWLSKTSMTSLRALSIAIVFVFMMVLFSCVAAYRIMDNSASANIVAPDVATTVQIASTALTRETSRQNSGKAIMDALLTVIAVAMGISAGAVFGDRTTSREHLEGKAKIEEGKERGRVAGVAAAAAAAQIVTDAKNGADNALITKEREAMRPPTGGE